jgi:RNA-directed DNA polymerase
VAALVNSASQLVLANEYAFAPYREMLKVKSAHKPPRQIAIPTLRDRTVLRAMAEHVRSLESSLKMLRPQEIVAAIRKEILARETIGYVRLDVINFYPSITHKSVDSALRLARADARFIALVQRALNTPVLPEGPVSHEFSPSKKGVPPGISLSNVLGELVMLQIDRRFESREDVSYFRYVDDILILCELKQVRKTRARVVRSLKKIGLRVHGTKSGKSASGSVTSDSITYLGYTFQKRKVTVDMSRTQKLISSIVRPVTSLRYAILDKKSLARVAARSEWWMNLSITGCIADETRRGWLPYYSQLDDIALLHRLDHVVGEILERIPVKHRPVPKSFVKAYTLTRDPKRDTAHYIPTLDNLSYAQKRSLLAVASKFDKIPRTKVDVDRLFELFKGTAIASLEVDVGGIS